MTHWMMRPPIMCIIKRRLHKRACAMKGVSAQWNIFSLFQTPSIPLGRGFEKEKISGSAIRKNENNILGLKLVVQQKGSIIEYTKNANTSQRIKECNTNRVEYIFTL